VGTGDKDKKLQEHENRFRFPEHLSQDRLADYQVKKFFKKDTL
jgi:hypothetical protein